MYKSITGKNVTAMLSSVFLIVAALLIFPAKANAESKYNEIISDQNPNVIQATSFTLKKDKNTDTEDKRQKVSGRLYACVSYEDDLYCTDSTALYKVDPENGSVSEFIKGSSCIENLYLNGSDLYYTNHGTGLGCEICCIDLESGSKRVITSEADAYEYVISDNRLYYSVFDSSRDSVDYVVYSVDLNGNRLKKEEGKVLDPVYESSNDSKYEYDHGPYNDYEWHTWITTNSGEVISVSSINVSRGCFRTGIIDAPVYSGNSFSQAAEEIAKRMEYYYWLYDQYLISGDDHRLSDGTVRVLSDKAGKFEVISSRPELSVSMKMYRNGRLCKSDEIPDRIEMTTYFGSDDDTFASATRFALFMTIDPGFGFENAIDQAKVSFAGDHDQNVKCGDADIRFETESIMDSVDSEDLTEGKIIVESR